MGGKAYRGSNHTWLGFFILLALLGLLILPGIGSLSVNVWVGSVATGLCFALVALGVFITFRVLNFPDLTIDGSFPLGASIAATLISSGFDPFLSLPVAFAGGALAGVATALIAIKLKIHSLLASILTTTALITVNLRVMGRSNIPLLNEATVFTPFIETVRGVLNQLGGENLVRLSNNVLAILLAGAVVLLVKLLFDGFMQTEIGLALRATGANPQMIRAYGTDTQKTIVLGLALSNGLVGLSGALFAQYQGFADVNMGLGLIIAGLAAVIVGETLFRPRSISGATAAVVLGMIVYRIAIAAALNIKIPLPAGEIFRIGTQDIKLATALIVLLALGVTQAQKRNEG
ncbi:MAG: ABC transporter permease [Bellilinea sp.]